MSKRTWALITLSQTTLFVVGVAGLGPGEDDLSADAGIAAWQAMRQNMRR